MRDALIDRYRSLIVSLGVVAAAAVLFIPDAAQGCAVCLGASANDPFARGLNWSILFLAAMPFTIVGSIGGWLLYKYRRRPQAGDRTEPSSRNAARVQKESSS